MQKANPLGTESTKGALFGQASAGVGDLDGDGIPDIAVAAPGMNDNDGALWLICLNRDGTVKAAKSVLPEEAKGKKGLHFNSLSLSLSLCLELSHP